MLSNMIMERRLRFFGHIGHSAPDEDNRYAVTAAIQKPPSDWKRPPGRPNHLSSYHVVSITAISISTIKTSNTCMINFIKIALSRHHSQVICWNAYIGRTVLKHTFNFCRVPCLSKVHWAKLWSRPRDWNRSQPSTNWTTSLNVQSITNDLRGWGKNQILFVWKIQLQQLTHPGRLFAACAPNAATTILPHTYQLILNTVP